MNAPRESPAPVPIPVHTDHENRHRSVVKRYFPSRNPEALAGYYLGVLSIIPVLGLPLALPALVRGISGLRAARRDPAVQGGGHAWVGIGFGGLSIGLHLGVALAYVTWANLA